MPELEESRLNAIDEHSPTVEEQPPIQHKPHHLDKKMVSKIWPGNRMCNYVSGVHRLCLVNTY